MLRHAVLVADLAAIFAVEDHYFDVALVAELPYSTIDSAYATFHVLGSFIFGKAYAAVFHALGNDEAKQALLRRSKYGLLLRFNYLVFNVFGQFPIQPSQF